jgi:ribosomal protein S18 acetylase RimI-like enzyme
VLVRDARADDADAVAAIVADGLAAKYRPALGDAAVRAIAALVRHDLEAGTGSRHLVAEVDGRIAGAVHLVTGDGPPAGMTRTLIRAVGPWTALRALVVLSLLAHEGVRPDEAYLDELAVAPWARRRGVGRALLEACVREGRRAGRRRLTLGVTTDNAPARALYAAAGFEETRRRRLLAGRLVFRTPGASLMARPLAPG